jgi:hypothetical protein
MLSLLNGDSSKRKSVDYCISLWDYKISRRRVWSSESSGMYCISYTVMWKLKLSHDTPWRHLGERKYSCYSFLTSALDGGEWSASRPGRTLPREKIPGTLWIGGWAGLRAGLDTEEKSFRLCWGSNLGRPVCSQNTILTELPQFNIKLTQTCLWKGLLGNNRIRTDCADGMNQLLATWSFCTWQSRLLHMQWGPPHPVSNRKPFR